MSVELITKSFRSCALTRPNDEQGDNQISCFKPGRPCKGDRKILNQEMKLLTDYSLHINQFFRDISDSDMEDAHEETNIIESNEEIGEILPLLFLPFFYIKKILRYFSLKPNFKLRWCCPRDLFGS